MTVVIIVYYGMLSCQVSASLQFMNCKVLRKYLIILVDAGEFSSLLLSEFLNADSNEIRCIGFLISVVHVNRKILYCCKPLFFGSVLSNVKAKLEASLENISLCTCCLVE